MLRKTVVTSWLILVVLSGIRVLPLLAQQDGLSLNFDAAASGNIADGWYQPETTSDGLTFQLMSRPQAELEVELPDVNLDHTLDFRVLRPLDAAMLDRLTVSANEVPLSVSYTPDDNGTIFTAVIPRSVGRESGGAVRLSFDVGEVVSPGDLGIPSADDRERGLGFDWLHISPALLAGYEFDDPVQGTGWNPPETTANNLSVQWMNTATATIDIGAVAPDSGLDVQFSVLRPFDPALLDHLILRIGDERLITTPETSEDGTTIFHTLISPSVVAEYAQNVQLTIEIDRVTSFAALGISDDDTPRGLAFDWVHINALENVESLLCAGVVETTLTQSTACNDMGDNQICLISSPAQAQFGDTGGGTFGAAGDRADLAALQSLQLSALNAAAGTWSVASMRVQAVRPDSTIGGIDLLLFGEVSLENAVTAADGPPILEVNIPSNMNVRSGPSSNNRVVTVLMANETALVNGRLDDNSWVRIALPDEAEGWAFAENLSLGDVISALPVVDPFTGDVTGAAPPLSSMQAFHFQSGGSPMTCAEVPANGLLLQSRTDEAGLPLIVNEASLLLRGTAFLQAQPDGEMIISVLDGDVQVRALDGEQLISAGLQARVPLNGAGLAADVPTAPLPFESATISASNLPLSLLPQPLVLAVSAASSDIQMPQATPTPRPLPNQYYNGDCGNGLAWRFQVNDRGWVMPDEEDPSGSGLRDTPGGNRTAILNQRDYFTVMGGPECTPSNGVTWYYVSSDVGFEGWISEGNNSEYWIEPVANVQVTGAVDGCVPALGPRLERDGEARQIQDEPLPVLAELDASEVSFYLYPDMVVTVMDGPECIQVEDAAVNYWQILNNQSLMGWIPEASVDSYILEPHGDDGEGEVE